MSQINGSITLVHVKVSMILSKNIVQLTLFSAPTEGCCDNCERSDLESKSISRSAGPATFPGNMTIDSVQSTSTSHAASPALTPHNLFDMQGPQLLDNEISPPQSPGTPISLLFSSPPPSPAPSDRSGDNDVPSDMINCDGKWPMREGSAQRRDEVRRQVREALVKWRDTKWEDEYSHCPWGPEGLLPDTVLTAFVSHGLWRDISDVKRSNSTAAIWWMWLDDHGQEVLDLANKVDMCARAEHAAKRQRLEAERAAARSQVWEEEARKKEAEHARCQEVADTKKRLKLEEAEKKKEAAAVTISDTSHFLTYLTHHTYVPTPIVTHSITRTFHITSSPTSL